MTAAQPISCLESPIPSPIKSTLAKRPVVTNDVFAEMENETALMFDAIAGKIEREPSLLSIPLNNIARWLAKGHPSVSRLNGWKAMIEEAMQSSSAFAALLALLRDGSPDAMQWKGFDPFPGILTDSELDALRQ